MNDKIQVANRELLVACFAAILDLFTENKIEHECQGGGAWKVVVYCSQNPALLDSAREYPSWVFEQTRDDPHMQAALVSAQSFVKNTVPNLIETKKVFDAEYDRLKEKFGADFGTFLQRATDRNAEESYESSTEWSSSASCW